MRAPVFARLLAVLVLASCSPSRISSRSSATVRSTPAGVAVVVPDFLLVRPDLVSAALLEIDAAAPPPGYSVEIHEPIFYQADWQLNVRGWVDLEAHVVHVGWRIGDYEPPAPLLPALAYEVANARAGHETGPLPSWVKAP